MRKPNQTPDRKRALRLFLAQTRGIHAWSDGSRLVEAEELRELRAAALNRLISLRGGPADRAEEGNARAWSNYHSLCRMRSGAQSGPVPLSDRIVADLRAAASGSDPGSVERRRLLRRALRRACPERAEEIPLRVRCGVPELDRVIAAVNRSGLATRRDLMVDGFPIPSGTPVILDPVGSARLTVPGLEHFPAGGLKLSDLKRNRPRTHEAAGPGIGPDGP